MQIIRKKEDLHGYQGFIAEHIIENTHCGIFAEMGMGKTAATLEAIHTLIYCDLEIDKVLLVAPKRVVEQVWDTEATKWEHLKKLTFSKVIGTPKKRLQALETPADIYLISRDNIAWLCGLYGGGYLPFDMLVIDEFSSFKNHKSRRFKALRKVQPSLKRVVGLTGTPAPNGLIDLWAQLWLLDRGVRLGRTITEYRSKYFKAGARKGDVIFNYKPNRDSDKLIHDRIKDICVSLKAKDHLTSKGVNHNPIVLKFDKKQKEAYENFERDQVLQIFSDDILADEEEFISATNAAALSNKLLQFTGGAVYDEDKNYHTVHKVKIDAAEELVESANGNPVLIAYNFKHELYRLQERLKKYKPRTLKTNQDKQDWDDGKIQVLLMHPASGGHGLNLQDGGHTMLWFGQNWSLELYEQLNKRLDRQGQEEPVIIHHFIMEGTIDEDVVASLTRKSSTQNDLMTAVKARINKYIKTH